jgi:hypothetical protein
MAYYSIYSNNHWDNFCLSSAAILASNSALTVSKAFLNWGCLSSSCCKVALC